LNATYNFETASNAAVCFKDRFSGVMILRPARNEDLNTVIGWIKDKEACKLWAGPLVRFPFTLASLKKGIEFSEDNTFVMANDAGELLGLGQLLQKENDRIHMARVIVSPLQRGRGFGNQLCRLLIGEGIKRFGNVCFSLNVYSDNTTALKLYQQLGFKPQSTPSDSTPDKGVIYMILKPDHTTRLLSGKNTEI
jgi:ribosomal protein S18 acetylase RimI-like enzyme